MIRSDKANRGSYISKSGNIIRSIELPLNAVLKDQTYVP